MVVEEAEDNWQLWEDGNKAGVRLGMGELDVFQLGF